MSASSALGVFFVLGLLGAPEMPVPAKLQGVLFKKIFSYDETLRGKGGVGMVLVAHAADGAVAAAEIVAAFAGVSIEAKASIDSAIADKVLGNSVVYFAAGADADAVLSAIMGKGVLTISGVTQFVEDGKVAIGVGLKSDGRSEIVVNLRRLKLDAHELNSRLLALAKVIK